MKVAISSGGGVTNIRSGPGTGYKIIGKVGRSGAVYNFKRDLGDWSEYDTGKYISDGYHLRTEILEQKIGVRYRSQLGNEASYASGDCGAAMVAAAIEAWNGEYVLVDDLSKAIGLNNTDHKTAWVKDLVRILNIYKIPHEPTVNLDIYKVIESLKQWKPIIWLVDYEKLPNRKFNNYFGGHYVFIYGYDSNYLWLHDPYSHSEFENKITLYDFIRIAAVSKYNLPTQGIIINPIVG